jgi:hypothetical protein
MKNSTNKFTVLLLFLFITWSCNDDATDGLQTFDDVLKQDLKQKLFFVVSGANRAADLIWRGPPQKQTPQKT